MTSSAPAGRPAAGCLTGLRQRKKQRTREALARAAAELFTARGYEATTVDAIAERVDVSQRTFFRYFSGKEDAAFVIEELVGDRLADAVAARPADEAPLLALGNALMETWQDLAVALDEIVPVELHMRMYQLVESTPALLAGRHRRQTRLEQRITEVVARREGLDPHADPRPRVLVAAFGGVVRTASHTMAGSPDASPEAVRRAFEEHLAAFGPALLGPWRAS
jgi:AcrR family transcriptional regulator